MQYVHEQEHNSGRSDSTWTIVQINKEPTVRYIQRLKGPTLGALLDRIRCNEDNITELDFSLLSAKNKKLEPFGGVLLARVLTSNHTVKKLIVRDHAIGDRGTIAIANMLRFNSTLQYIDLYANEITDRGAEALAKALYGHESLEHLSLWSNHITDVGASAFADALACNRSLKYLGLVHNRITKPGGENLLRSLETNYYLETLNLATNRVPVAIISKIRVTLSNNRSVAPQLLKMIEDEEDEVRRRIVLMKIEKWELEGTSSDSSGFLSCGDTDDDFEEDEEDDGDWITEKEDERWKEIADSLWI